MIYELTFMLILIAIFGVCTTLLLVSSQDTSEQQKDATAKCILGSILDHGEWDSETEEDSDSDNNEELEPASVIYPRSFLVQFEHIFTERPDDLPDGEIIKTEGEVQAAAILGFEPMSLKSQKKKDKKCSNNTSPSNSPGLRSLKMAESDYNSSSEDEQDTAQSQLTGWSSSYMPPFLVGSSLCMANKEGAFVKRNAHHHQQRISSSATGSQA